MPTNQPTDKRDELSATPRDDAQPSDVGDIVERLEARKWRNAPGGCVQTKTFVNPDGPEAAATIRQLSADDAALQHDIRRAQATLSEQATEIVALQAKVDEGLATGEHCTMGVGCNEVGRCYAAAHGRPEQCPLSQPSDVGDIVERLEDEAAALQRAAWARPDGGQDACIAANLATEAAATIRQLSADDAAKDAWQPIETLTVRDAVVLIAVEPTEENRVYPSGRELAIHPAYVDEDGRLCAVDAGTPDLGFQGKYWRSTHWQPMPKPPTLSNLKAGQ